MHQVATNRETVNQNLAKNGLIKATMAMERSACAMKFSAMGHIVSWGFILGSTFPL